MALLKAIQTDSFDKIEAIVESKSISKNSKWLDYEALNSSIECGRKDVAMLLLKNNYRVNRTSKSKVPINSPLHNAVKLGDLDLIHSLLDKKASIKAVNSEGDTPLHLAFMTRQEDIVDVILEYIENTSSYVNVANNQGLTHMHIACSRNNKKIVEKFLEAGVDLNDSINPQSTLWPGYTALHFAVDFGSLEVVTVLKKASSCNRAKDCNGHDPLKLAYKKLNDFSIVVHTLSAEDQNTESDQQKQLSYFHMACLRTDPIAVETFIKNGADVNLAISSAAVFCPLYTPLHCAVESNCKRNVELLLEHGANVDFRNGIDMTPLHLALYNEDHKQKDTIVDLLYNAMPNKQLHRPDINGLTFFHIAVTRNDVRLVKKHLASKLVDVNDPILFNSRNFSHFTPLHFSVMYGHQEMTELLIKEGGNFNRSDCGWHGTPLHLAIENGHQGIVELLLEKGARIDKIRVYDNRTTLHLLVDYCVSRRQDKDDWCLKYIERMINECDVNAKDEDGNTALHLACAKLNNGSKCARLLLEFGANIDIENEQGYTPFDMSFCLGNEVDVKDYLVLFEHVYILQSLGYKINPKNEACNKKLIETNQQRQQPKEQAELIKIQQIETEIVKLKKMKLSQRVSLLDFLLLEDQKRIAYYTKNDVLKNVIESEDLNELYPCYAYQLKLQYRKGMTYVRTVEAEKRAANVDFNSNTRADKKRRL